MYTPIPLMKRKFIKRWTAALKTCCKFPINEMCVIENKNIIKRTAAIAMAATKGGSTAWSRAIIADEYDQMDNKILVEAVMGSQNPAKLKKKFLCNFKSSSHYISKQKVSRSKMIRRSRSRSRVLKASSLAKSIVKKQTLVLRKLMPGGEAIDESCLIEEALNYIVSLKAQVDVMKELVNLMQLST